MAALELVAEAGVEAGVELGARVAEETTERVAERAAEGAAERAAEGATEGAAESAAEGAAESAAEGAAESAAEGAAERAAEKEAEEAAKKGLSKRALDGVKSGLGNLGVKGSLIGGATALFLYYFQTEGSCIDACKENETSFVGSLNEVYKPLWDEKCKNKLESQECKEFCENVSEDTDPLGVCSSNSRTQRATAETVSTGVSGLGMLAGIGGGILKGGGEELLGAFWSVLKGIFTTSPIFGIICVIICCGGIIYKANSLMSGGGKSNRNIKLYFLFIFFMFIIYNERN